MPPLSPRKPGCKNTFVILFLLVRFDLVRSVLKGISPNVGLPAGQNLFFMHILAVHSFVPVPFSCRRRAVVASLHPIVTGLPIRLEGMFAEVIHLGGGNGDPS